MQFKIINFFDNGDISEEDSFYREEDIMKSVEVFEAMLCTGEHLLYYRAEEVRLKAYEVWKYGKIVERREM